MNGQEAILKQDRDKQCNQEMLTWNLKGGKLGRDGWKAVAACTGVGTHSRRSTEELKGAG